MSAGRSLTISRYDEKRCNRPASVYITSLFLGLCQSEKVDNITHPRPYDEPEKSDDEGVEEKARPHI